MRHEEIETVKEFFFRGMLNGYVEPNAKKLLNLIINTIGSASRPIYLPDSKAVVFEDMVGVKLMRLVDLWFSVKGSDFSGGMTIILMDGKPVWMMNYGGHYRAEAIPTLKLALKDAYGKKKFYGGRGSRNFKNGDCLYSNDFEHGDFRSFYGFEHIFQGEDELKYCLGRHQYHGFLLVPVEKEQDFSIQ